MVLALGQVIHAGVQDHARFATSKGLPFEALPKVGARPVLNRFTHVMDNILPALTLSDLPTWDYNTYDSTQHLLVLGAFATAAATGMSPTASARPLFGTGTPGGMSPPPTDAVTYMSDDDGEAKFSVLHVDATEWQSLCMAPEVAECRRLSALMNPAPMREYLFGLNFNTATAPLRNFLRFCTQKFSVPKRAKSSAACPPIAPVLQLISDVRQLLGRPMKLGFDQLIYSEHPITKTNKRKLWQLIRTFDESPWGAALPEFGRAALIEPRK